MCIPLEKGGKRPSAKGLLRLLRAHRGLGARGQLGHGDGIAAVHVQFDGLAGCKHVSGVAIALGDLGFVRPTVGRHFDFDFQGHFSLSENGAEAPWV